MKLINKVFCFLFVLVSILPVMCFPVSADGQDTGFNDSDSVLASLPNFDTTDFSAYDLTFLENTLQSLLFGSGKIEKLREDSAYLPFEGSINGNNYLGVSKRCEQTVFLYGLINALQSGLVDVNLPVYYYLHYFTYLDSNNNTFYCYNYLFSNNVFEFVNYDSTHNAIKFNKTLHRDVSLRYPLLSNISVGYTKTSGNQTSYIYSKSDFTYCGLNNIKSYSGYKSESLFCNFDIKGLDLFNTDIVAVNGFESVKPKDFKTQIDVKLTPAFSLDMDRIDSFTNQSDYFKFEITNNSDSAIQWIAGIYDPTVVDIDTKSITVYSNWNYVSRVTYYDSKVDTEKSIFRNTDTYTGVVKTGSSSSHWLGPGEKFSDVVYWENIKINANVVYHFFVNAIKTNLNCATEVINPVVVDSSSDIHNVTVVEQSYKDVILFSDIDFTQLEANVFNVEFSCLSMPAFTTTVRGGNSVVNTSSNDRYKLDRNYESISDIDGKNTKINKDYIDPAILANQLNRSDVNVDIDNLSIDNVKEYVTTCQSFFTLLKNVLTSFPAFIWVIICFGLTALIVIGIIRYIRG